MLKSRDITRIAIASLAVSVSAVAATPQTKVLSRSAPPAELLQAAKNDDMTGIQRLLARHVDVNAAQGDGFTALHWAAYNDDVALTKLLLKAGANAEPRSRLEGATPLILAVQNGDTALIDALLAGGAKVDTANDNGTTPLMQAAAAGSPDVLEDLLGHGANINARETTYGQSALFFAASHDRTEAIRVLAAHGANTSFTTKVQKLDRISVGADGEEVKDQNKKNAGSEKADLEKKDAELVASAELKTLPASEQKTGSNQATGASDKEKPSRPADSADKKKPSPGNAKKDEPDAYGFTAEDRRNRVYGSLSMGGLSALHVAARDGQLDATRALLAAHADINARSGTDKATPLLLALINGHYDVAKLLVEQGADVRLTSTDGLGPLYALIDVQWAPHTWYPQPVTAQEKTGYLDLLTELLDRKADINVMLTRKLWFRGFANDETWVEVAGATPFWRAALAGDLTAMKLLAASGADTQKPSKSGDTPLMVAAGLGWAAYWTSNAPSSRLDAVRFCLEHGGDLSVRDVKGYTALHGAAFRGDEAMVDFMLAHGADLHSASKQGDTVADAANGLFEHAVVHPDTVARLEKLGSKNNNNCRSNECVAPTREDKKPASVVAAKSGPMNSPQASADAAEKRVP